MAAAEELLALIAHDVATPLAGVRRLAEHLAAMDDDLSPAAQEVAAALAASAARTSTVLEELLAYARGAAPAGRKPVALDELLREVVGDLRPLLEERRTTVAWEPLPTLWVRPVALRQVLVNLLSNVARHAGPGARAEVSAATGDGGVVLRVADDGPGMAAPARAVLEGPAEPPDGRLGLFLTRRLAESEGGRVWVEDRPGGGAIVCIGLPGRARGQRRSRARARTASA